jgi:hypothetical protein
MKRFLPALGLGAAISLLWVSAANAAPPPVNQTHGSDSVAEAGWGIDDDPNDGDLTTNILNMRVDHTSSFTGLFVEQDITQWRIDRECEGQPGCPLDQFRITRTRIAVTSGFTFSLQSNLKGATLSGSQLPAEECTYDADTEPEPGDCSDLKVSLSVKWVGIGEISRDTDAAHIGPPTFPFVNNDLRINFVRKATATGSFDGITDLGTADSAILADNKALNVGVPL